VWEERTVEQNQGMQRSPAKHVVGWLRKEKDRPEFISTSQISLIQAVRNIGIDLTPFDPHHEPQQRAAGGKLNVIFRSFFILATPFLLPHLASPPSAYDETHCAIASAHLCFS